MTLSDGTISPFIRAMIVRNADGSLKAPDNIIKTLPAAYQQYISVRNTHLDRIELYAAIEGMIGGNPPYDEAELAEHGLGHIANFNNFKARSSYEKAAQGYWNLINSTEVFVDISLAGNFPKSEEYAETMARHFSDVVKEWPDFEPNFNLLGAQLTKFGLSPIFFPHEESPLWEVVDVSRFYIPSQSQSYTSKLTNISIDTTYTVQDLYQIYSGTEDSDNWNKEALGDFLILRANALTPNTMNPIVTMMDVQRLISNNDANVQRYFTDTVRLVNMYQVEYNDGRVSHYIFSADMFNTVTAKPNGVNEVTDFLYFADRQYQNIEDAVVIFTASPGEWTIHGNLGLGQKMFAMAQAINMLDCSIVDMSRMSATPLVRTLAAGGKDGSAIRFYPGVVTDIGAAEFQQNNLGANINQLVGASSYLTQGIDINMINSGDDPSTPDKAQGSIAPSIARQQAFKEFGVLRNAVAHFYNIFDKVVRITFIRFLTMKENAPGYEYAKEWKERCIEDGVPDFLFDTVKKGLHGLPRQFRKVKASRVAGDGSTLARIMGLEALDKIATTFNPAEMSAYKKEWVAATMGVDYVSTFAGSDGQADEAAGGFSLAVAENGLMELGKQVAFSPDNEHDQHANAHMQLLTQTAQGVQQQQMSPVDADKIFSLAIPHMQQHVQFMVKSPLFYGQILRGIDKPFKQIVQFAELNRRTAEAMVEAAQRKQQEDAAASQGVMKDAQRKDFVAAKDVARKDKESQAKETRADQQSRTKAKVMEEKVREDARVKELKVRLDATVKGRAQDALQNESPDQLASDLTDMQGSSPSPKDFEPLPSSPSIGEGAPASTFGLPSKEKPVSSTSFKSRSY